MTQLHESGAYPADAVAVFALISDAAFRTESAESQGSTDVDVQVETDGDDTVVTIVRDHPADGIPDFIAKFVGSTVKVKQIETWGPAGTDGARTGSVRVKIIGQPAEMKGTSTLSADGDSSRLSLDGDVKVSVPFLGKKIEPEIAKVITSALRHDIAAGAARLG